MAGENFKLFVAGATLPASDLNDLQTQLVTTNDQSVGTPRSSSYDMNAQELILDDNQNSSLRAESDDLITLKLAGTDLFKWDGSGTTPVNGVVAAASATTVDVSYTATGSDTNISVDLVPKGNGAVGTNGVEASWLMYQVFS